MNLSLIAFINLLLHLITSHKMIFAINIAAVTDQSTSIPCRAFISAKRINGLVTLMRWFHSSFHKPLYTLDLRSLNASLLLDSSIIHKGRHFPSPETEGRFYLDLSLNPIALRIDPVLSADAGEYKCQIDFRNKRSVQSTVTLSVIAPPKEAIIRNSKGMKVEGVIGPFYIGQSIELVCDSLGGYPKPTASWKSSHYDLERMSINGSQIIIYSISREDQWAHFTCIVQNSHMTASKSVTVTIELVLPPMELVLKSSNPKPFINGENVQMSCQSFGSYPRAHVVWKKSGEFLEADERITDNGNVTTSFIEFSVQASDDEKEIQCISFNPDMKHYILRRSFIIEVYYKPEVQIFLLSNQSQLIEGQNLALICSVRANPETSTIIWIFNSRKIVNSTSFLIKETTLYIKNLTPNHSGKFDCIAQNDRGEGNDSVHLTIKHKPICREIDLYYTYGQKRNKINVTCNLVSYPDDDVTFYWIHRSSSFNHSWTTGQVSHTQMELQASNSEIICWGRNEIGVQTQPCRISLEKNIDSVDKTYHLQNSLISSCVVIICIAVIFIILRRYRLKHNSVSLKSEITPEIEISESVSSAEPSISSNESCYSTSLLTFKKKYPDPPITEKYYEIKT